MQFSTLATLMVTRLSHVKSLVLYYQKIIAKFLFKKNFILKNKVFSTKIFALNKSISIDKFFETKK